MTDYIHQNSIWTNDNSYLDIYLRIGNVLRQSSKKRIDYNVPNIITESHNKYNDTIQYTAEKKLIKTNYGYFEFYTFITNTIQSYHHDSSRILNQLFLDFPRANYKINDKQVTDINILLNEVNKYESLIEIDDILYPLRTVIISLLSQGASAFSCITMTKQYLDVSNGIYVLSGDSEYSINNVSSDVLNVIIKNSYPVKYLTENMNNIANIETIITIEFTRTKCNLWIPSRYGFMEWKYTCL